MVREDVKKWNIDEEYFNYEKQKELLLNGFQKVEPHIQKLINNELTKKIRLSFSSRAGARVRIYVYIVSR